MNKHDLNFFSLSGSFLKLIAVISMLIDHTGAAVIRPLRTALSDSFPAVSDFLNHLYPITRDIGRIAFPIFCFFLVEGFFHTGNLKNYTFRLFRFALISELPYDFALGKSLFDWKHQNVYFTLLLGLLFMITLSALDRKTPRNKAERYVLRFLQISVCVIPLFLAKHLYTDYRFRGVMLIEILYAMRCPQPKTFLDRAPQAAIGAVAISWEDWGPAGFLPLLFYNGMRGNTSKQFFYWFYPIHLTILGLIRLWINTL